MWTSTPRPTRRRVKSDTETPGNSNSYRWNGRSTIVDDANDAEGFDREVRYSRGGGASEIAASASSRRSALSASPSNDTPATMQPFSTFLRSPDSTTSTPFQVSSSPSQHEDLPTRTPVIGSEQSPMKGDRKRMLHSGGGTDSVKSTNTVKTQCSTPFSSISTSALSTPASPAAAAVGETEILVSSVPSPAPTVAPSPRSLPTESSRGLADGAGRTGRDLFNSFVSSLRTRSSSSSSSSNDGVQHGVDGEGDDGDGDDADDDNSHEPPSRRSSSSSSSALVRRGDHQSSRDLFHENDEEEDDDCYEQQQQQQQRGRKIARPHRTLPQSAPSPRRKHADIMPPHPRTATVPFSHQNHRRDAPASTPPPASGFRSVGGDGVLRSQRLDVTYSPLPPIASASFSRKRIVEEGHVDEKDDDFVTAMEHHNWMTSNSSSITSSPFPPFLDSFEGETLQRSGATLSVSTRKNQVVNSHENEQNKNQLGGKMNRRAPATLPPPKQHGRPVSSGSVELITSVGTARQRRPRIRHKSTSSLPSSTSSLPGCLYQESFSAAPANRKGMGNAGGRGMSNPGIALMHGDTTPITSTSSSESSPERAHVLSLSATGGTFDGRNIASDEEIGKYKSDGHKSDSVVWGHYRRPATRRSSSSSVPPIDYIPGGSMSSMDHPQQLHNHHRFGSGDINDLDSPSYYYHPHSYHYHHHQQSVVSQPSTSMTNIKLPLTTRLSLWTLRKIRIRTRTLFWLCLGIIGFTTLTLTYWSNRAIGEMHGDHRPHQPWPGKKQGSLWYRMMNGATHPGHGNRREWGPPEKPKIRASRGTNRLKQTASLTKEGDHGIEKKGKSSISTEGRDDKKDHKKQEKKDTGHTSTTTKTKQNVDHHTSAAANVKVGKVTDKNNHSSKKGHKIVKEEDGKKKAQPFELQTEVRTFVGAPPLSDMKKDAEFDEVERLMYERSSFRARKSTGQRSSRHRPRVLSLNSQIDLPDTREVEPYPADFSDNTQYYSVLDSSDERLSGMEIREPYEDGDCVPMKEWQTTFHPSCNGMHEIGLEHLGEEKHANLFGTKGYWRNAWKIDFKQDSSPFVLKTLKYGHNFEDAHFEHDRIDAVAMERLTKSPHVINIYGFCGHSVLTEYADGPRLGTLADKSKKKPLKRLRIARDIASGLADVHGIDGDGNATFVHLDINPANVVVINGTLKLNDFNIGIILRWNKKTNKHCGFPAQYPNPQWRSPEEAQNSQELTEKVDVFSMGHIFFRMICGHEPWNKLEPGGRPTKEEVNEKVKKGILPHIPEFIMKSKDPEIIAIRDAMLKCYEKDPTKRPSARSIAKALEEALDRLQEEE